MGWSSEEGIRIVRQVEFKRRSRNDMDTRLDFENNVTIEYGSKYYKEYLEAVSSLIDDQNTVDFDELLVKVIEEKFDGESGWYWIGGRDSDAGKGMANLWKVPVRYFYFDGEEITEDKTRSYSKKKKSSSKKYIYIELINQ